MICDLSIEALVRFARLHRRVQIGYLNIPGLSTEHLAPMIQAGWITQTKGPLYEITDAGQTAVRNLTAHLRTLLP